MAGSESTKPSTEVFAYSGEETKCFRQCSMSWTTSSICRIFGNILYYNKIILLLLLSHSMLCVFVCLFACDIYV